VSARTPSLRPLIQGAFYLASGLWPILHRRSFEKVTGPRNDRLLVNALGAAVTVLGASLVLGAFRSSSRPALLSSGAGTSMALAAADTLYGGKTRFRPSRIIDTIAEAALFAAMIAKQRRAAR
jgi:hypothetical protein